jgi:RimJ/RimL family protein N-acetyltransferase
MVQIRQAVESDHGRVLRFLSHDPLNWVDAETYRRYLESGSYGVDRIWLAEEKGGDLAACAVWYAPDRTNWSPVLDCFRVATHISDRAALGGAVLRAAHAAFNSASEIHLFLKPDWRRDESIAAEVEWRRAAARRAGLTNLLERLRYEWTSETGVPPASGRLLFSAETNDDVFVELFRRVAAGSLDYETQQQVAKLGDAASARATLARERRMRGDRSWWRIARTPAGDVVGFAIPSANEDFPVIGYLGVVPEMRGHGYAVDLLAEATHILAGNGAERIRSDTDMANVPMAKAFERAGYRNFSVRLIISSGPA